MVMNNDESIVLENSEDGEEVSGLLMVVKFSKDRKAFFCRMGTHLVLGGCVPARWPCTVTLFHSVESRPEFPGKFSFLFFCLHQNDS